MNAVPPRRRRALLSGVGVAVATLLVGCQALSPRQTEVMYDAGDGVSVDVGDIAVRNLLIVSDRKGGPGVLSAALGNPTGESVEVTIAGADGAGSTTVQVPAYATVNLSSDGKQVSLSPVPVEPGGVTQVTVSSASAGSSPVDVPVLPPTGIYESFKPAA